MSLNAALVLPFAPSARIGRKNSGGAWLRQAPRNANIAAHAYAPGAVRPDRHLSFRPASQRSHLTRDASSGRRMRLRPKPRLLPAGKVRSLCGGLGPTGRGKRPLSRLGPRALAPGVEFSRRGGRTDVLRRCLRGSGRQQHRPPFRPRRRALRVHAAGIMANPEARWDLLLPPRILDRYGKPGETH